MRKTTALRKLIESGKTYLIPGVYDGLSARIAQAAGAELLYATGGGIARSTGIPDMGLFNPVQIVERLEQIVDSVDVPVIADFDTGYGNALNALHTLKGFERAGVAGFHIEDQVFPKRCGHMEGKAVVPAAELASKIRAIKDNAADDDLIVIARTDSVAVEGFDAALDRMHLYMEAGADVAFIEAPTTVEQIERISTEFSQPKLLNMFWSGKTPVLQRAKLEELGINLVIAPGDLQRAAMHAMRQAADAILRDGHTESLSDVMATFDDREVAINSAKYMALDEKYAV
ncbi:MAG: isocitrate lyase/PEP mutase family protein [Alphaproteobacteria bacterium]|jgi:2-methylisocitrate lyase-like PEP mutase family enzyme|tara:strand:- start:211 stop:1071 length:861 start_codon:yes stop_codon:yes gene_type:complete